MGADRLQRDAERVVQRAREVTGSEAEPPWTDPSTDEFARYWFAEPQLEQLSRLASVLKACRYQTRDLLRVCFSRLVITKDRGASLARDVSHSRPHRVTDENDFDVYVGFLRAAQLVGKRVNAVAIRGTAVVQQGDVSRLSREVDGLFDAAMTSPPYLNAIDYLRGHRLSLIWFGHSVDELQLVRAGSIGAERGLPEAPFEIDPFIDAPQGRSLPPRYLGWIRRYATDSSGMLGQLRAVVRPGGRIVLVVGNSLLKGASVDNAGIVIKAARSVGLDLEGRNERMIPARRRYLPPPKEGSAFSKRMRSEAVITFRVP